MVPAHRAYRKCSSPENSEQCLWEEEEEVDEEEEEAAGSHTPQRGTDRQGRLAGRGDGTRECVGSTCRRGTSRIDMGAEGVPRNKEGAHLYCNAKICSRGWEERRAARETSMEEEEAAVQRQGEHPLPRENLGEACMELQQHSASSHR